MPKIAKALSALEVKRLTTPGLHPVGTVSGLRLRVKESGARSWVLRTTIGTRRAEIGLGSYPGVTLANAIEAARQAVQLVKSGVDPVSDRRARQSVIEWTFKRCAEAYIEDHRPSWRNAKHAQQWESTLSAYAYPMFGHKHVRDVGKGDVLATIQPQWSTKNETMVRLRNRIELVIAWAMQREYRPEGVNPARWRGNLDAALPKPSKVNKRKHFEAVPIDDMPAFMKRLREVQGTSARALEFAILTASRTGAVRAATWDQIDLRGRVWTSPGELMKSGRAHRVPLAEPVVALLESLDRFEGVPLVFSGPWRPAFVRHEPDANNAAHGPDGSSSWLPIYVFRLVRGAHRNTGRGS
jgi:integrase